MVKGYSIDFLQSPYQTSKTPKVRLGQAQRVVWKVCYSKSNSSEKPGCQPLLSCFKERFWPETSHKSERTKAIHTLQPLQNGGLNVMKEILEEGTIFASYNSKLHIFVLALARTLQNSQGSNEKTHFTSFFAFALNWA